jgi:phosphoribosylformylglycinamidine synthase
MGVFRAEVRIKLKKGVADPEGANTKRALELLGFKGLSEVSSIKTFEIIIKAKDAKAATRDIEEMCRRLLANPVIHYYTITVKGE